MDTQKKNLLTILRTILAYLSNAHANTYRLMRGQNDCGGGAHTQWREINTRRTGEIYARFFVKKSTGDWQR